VRLPNEVRAAKCSDRWIGLRSPVSCAKPTTSDDDTVFSSVSVMPTERSSKNSVRSGARSMLAGSSRARRLIAQNVDAFPALFQASYCFGFGGAVAAALPEAGPRG